jgi:hypothetical protein
LKLTFSIFLIIISFVNQAQNALLEASKDSDAILYTCNEIALNKISRIDFIELLDTTCFKNYPLPPASVRYIKHSCTYNSNGLCEHYDWSFSENNSIQKVETDTVAGHFFIPNEYDFIYEKQHLKEIRISDVSLIRNVAYVYTNDSIYLNFSYFLNNGNLTEKKIAYSKLFIDNKCIISHTGIKKYYYPKIQIINLGIINSSTIFINGIPVYSFMNGKFEQKRFFLEIHPGLFIFFEIVE